MMWRRVAVLCLCVLLAAACAYAAEKKAEKPVIPDGLKGFSGQLHGTVVEVQDSGRGFRLKVDDVGKLWKGNKAKDAESAVGKTLLINVRWTKGDNGRWHPVERHVKFIKSLEKDEEILIEAVNDEGERLHILELSESQRKRAK